MRAGLRALDERLDAMRPAAELREASRQMGRQTLRVAAALTEDRCSAGITRRSRRAATPAHHAVVFGALGGVLGWAKEAAALAYLHTATVVLVGAALRLLPMGQLEGQRVLSSVRTPHRRGSRTRPASATDDDLWGFTPGIDAASMRHAQLEARLFRS